MTSSSYRSGDWFAIFGEQATVLLPPDAKPRVAAVWELADSGAGFDDVLDGLIAGGLKGLAAFALISKDEEPLRVLVRGEVIVRLDLADGEQAAVDGRAAATWVEQTLSDVASLRVDVGEGRGDDLLIDRGLVRVSRIDQPPAAAASLRLSEAPVESDVDAATGALTPESDDLADLATEMLGTSPRLESLAEPPTFQLVFSHGEVVDVDEVVLVGRAPVVRGAPDAEVPRLVTVPSPHHEISSTHIEVRPGTGPDLGSIVVADLNSTNGTVVLLPGQPPEELRPGTGFRLAPGALIDLGEGVVIEVRTGPLPGSDTMAPA